MLTRLLLTLGILITPVLATYASTEAQEIALEQESELSMKELEDLVINEEGGADAASATQDGATSEHNQNIDTNNFKQIDQDRYDAIAQAKNDHDNANESDKQFAKEKFHSLKAEYIAYADYYKKKQKLDNVNKELRQYNKPKQILSTDDQTTKQKLQLDYKKAYQEMYQAEQVYNKTKSPIIAGIANKPKPIPSSELTQEIANFKKEKDLFIKTQANFFEVYNKNPQAEYTDPAIITSRNEYNEARLAVAKTELRIANINQDSTAITKAQNNIQEIEASKLASAEKIEKAKKKEPEIKARSNKEQKIEADLVAKDAAFKLKHQAYIEYAQSTSPDPRELARLQKAANDAALEAKNATIRLDDYRYPKTSKLSDAPAQPNYLQLHEYDAAYNDYQTALTNYSRHISKDNLKILQKAEIHLNEISQQQNMSAPTPSNQVHEERKQGPEFGPSATSTDLVPYNGKLTPKYSAQMKDTKAKEAAEQEQQRLALEAKKQRIKDRIAKKKVNEEKVEPTPQPSASPTSQPSASPTASSPKTVGPTSAPTDSPTTSSRVKMPLHKTNKDQLFKSIPLIPNYDSNGE